MINLIIFIVLYAYSPGSQCTIPRCCVLHLDSPARIEICQTIEEVNKLTLYKDTKVYQYNIETKELKQFSLTPIKEIQYIGQERITGYKVGEKEINPFETSLSNDWSGSINSVSLDAQLLMQK